MLLLGKHSWLKKIETGDIDIFFFYFLGRIKLRFFGKGLSGADSEEDKDVNLSESSQKPTRIDRIEIGPLGS